ncbi:alkyl hydroperoxide reductase/ thiol specific antioxidant/ Mal allergen [Oceaniovalibus guishaninsula JLT2003]|uniref:Alkyl hydroperoxide reductase/ thiol specific antioxidant/ Mal allergen n=1 Tax=Oceaniovalibus guishaninsula JLT2003 TaxID=1231392 RepID=K2HB90_9RHOB|nr:redoxin domain-containing protein [Oceaniovalibus guishaninsula]EKE44733.1 alkyl hydroperoxide reductase/ thiol specific antioxidant/ Mal allergen [Oceaniovalibus guishaninsula JLT2003]
MPTTPTPGAPAPALTVPLIIGTEWSLDRQEPDSFTMIVVYRGLHCPVCKAYLQGLKALYQGYLDKGFNVLTLSMDPEDKAKKAHDDWDLADIPMGYGLTEDQARDWGLYLSDSISDAETSVFAEPAVFWVKPDGTLYMAAISNMPFARPDLEFLLGKADFIAEKDYPPRGTHG